MRMINADAFKEQVAAMTIKENLPVNKANAMLKLIDAQPTVNGETKVESCGYDELYTEWFKCENCGHENIISTVAYCPNCGKKIVWKKREE